jgi:hypothetical protein
LCDIYNANVLALVNPFSCIYFNLFVFVRKAAFFSRFDGVGLTTPASCWGCRGMPGVTFAMLLQAASRIPMRFSLLAARDARPFLRNRDKKEELYAHTAVWERKEKCCCTPSRHLFSSFKTMT